MKHTLFAALIGTGIIFSACGGSGSNTSSTTDTAAVGNDSSQNMGMKEENVDISADSTTMKSFVAFDDSKAGKKPIVLVVPEWWGLNDFTKSKARQLAQEGYLALA